MKPILIARFPAKFRNDLHLAQNTLTEKMKEDYYVMCVIDDSILEYQFELINPSV